MNSINDFKYPSQISMENLLKKGEKNNIAQACFDNNITKISNKLAIMNSETNIEIIHTPIYLDLLFNVYLKQYDNLHTIENKFDDIKYRSPLHILNLWCNYYENDTAKQVGFNEVLNKYMKQKKNIFVYFDFHDYLINEEVLEQKNLVEHFIHSTCCLIYLDKNNKYTTYYFNSHGNALSESTCIYQKYITRKRYKNLHLNYPIDFYVLNHLFKYINNQNKQYYPTSPHIHYEPTQTYNYCGPNLQGGDKFGICFAFPFLFYINLISNFRNKCTLEIENKKYKFTSFCKLLKNNDASKMIQLIMCNYNKTCKQLVIQHKNNKNDKLIDHAISLVIKKAGTNFTKYLYSLIYNFITQKYFT